MGSLGSSEPTRTVRRLDIGKYLNGTEAEKKAFCEDIVDDMCNVGFVKLSNHSITPAQVDAVFDWVCTITLWSALNRSEY
jgi:isopenicillin N synthase-like dioxygenase